MQKKIVALALFVILLLSMTVLTTTTRAATETDIENAIARGVAYLAGRQNPDGSWGSYAYYSVALTGLVLVKLEMRAYELRYESPFDPLYPYSSNVTAGWKFIFSKDGAGNPVYALKQPLSLQDHTAGASGTIDNPDTNGNLYGIYFSDPQVYNTGIILMALEASGTPDRANDGGIDYDGNGIAETFKQIAQDTADWLAWAQGDLVNDQGGYGYDRLDNAGGPDAWTDNSNTGYAYLGLAAAEGFGCTVPAWVRTELNVWITTIQDPVDGNPDDGGSYYNPDWLPWNPMVNELKSGNLMFQMTFYGDTQAVQRFKDAMAYIARHWNDMNNDPGWGHVISPSNYQAMFCLMKGFVYSKIDLIDLDGDGTLEYNWYNEFATVLVSQQNPADGSWFSGMYVGDPTIDTAWALLTLEKVVPPRLTPGKVTGGGQIAIPLPSLKTGKASFGFNIMYQEGDPAPKGELQYVDHTTKMIVHSETMTSIIVSKDKTKATFRGTCTINGIGGFTFSAYVEDNGEPGKNDVFKISLSNGISAGGTLLNGNIQIHKKP